MPKCEKCGTDNTPQAKFCRQCGSTLSLTATDLDASELLARLQHAKDEAERKVPELQAALDARGRELSAAIEKSAALERELAAAKAVPPSAADGTTPSGSMDHTVHETLQKLLIEKDDLTGALAAAAAHIKDLEQRLAADLSNVKTAGTQRKWLTPALAAALALVTGLAGFNYLRGNNGQNESTQQTQLLETALDGAKKTIAGLQQEVETLRKSPPPVTPSGPGVDPKTTAALAAREKAVHDAEEKNTQRASELETQARKLKDGEQQLADGNRKLADERKVLDATRKEMKTAPPRVAANPAAPFGFLVWQGRMQAAAEIFITGSQAVGGGEVSGTLPGALPGRKCEVRDEKIGARTKIMPGPNNNWNQAVISPEPGRVSTVLFVWTCAGR
jgi:hypothetical protein